MRCPFCEREISGEIHKCKWLAALKSTIEKRGVIIKKYDDEYIIVGPYEELSKIIQFPDTSYIGY